MQLLNMKKSSSSLISLTIMLLHMLSSCEGAIKLPPNVTVPAVFAFGDSIVDQGNNNDWKTIIKANFFPYGKDFQGGVPTGRFCNGKTPLDLIAGELGIKDIVPAYLDPILTAKDLPTGVCFASGGSGYDPQTPQLVSVISLPDQLKYFKDCTSKLKAAVGEETTNKILTNSLYLVVAGSDDLANTYFTFGFRKKQYDVPSYADLLVSSASSFIKELYKLGARRMAVFGIPPIGCLPAQRTLAGGPTRMCKEEYNEAAKVVNTKFSSTIDSLSKSLPQSRVVFIDIYKPLLDIILKPQNYGFEVSNRGCCGSGDLEVSVLCNKFTPTCPDDTKYVFWDSYHPTERTYKVLVDQILSKYIDKLS